MLYIIEDMINGILMGSIYGLTAMGLTIIFGVLKVINFAHGSLLMVGMYATYWAITLTGVHPYLALAMVIPAMFVFGYYLQNIVIKPIFIAEKNVREPITVIIVTTGIWYILDNLALLVFGPQYRSLADNPLKGQMLELGGDVRLRTQILRFHHRHQSPPPPSTGSCRKPSWAGPSGPPAWTARRPA